MRTVLIVFGLILLITGCSKQAGEGGGAAIKGKVMTEVRAVLNNPSSVVATYPAADEDVFIIYGDNTSPDDRVQTNYDGEFEIQYLRRGQYTLYIFSEDTLPDVSSDPNAMPIIHEIDINDRNETIDLGTIFRYEEN